MTGMSKPLGCEQNYNRYDQLAAPKGTILLCHTQKQRVRMFSLLRKMLLTWACRSIQCTATELSANCPILRYDKSWKLEMSLTGHLTWKGKKSPLVYLLTIYTHNHVVLYYLQSWQPLGILYKYNKIAAIPQAPRLCSTCLALFDHPKSIFYSNLVSTMGFGLPSIIVNAKQIPKVQQSHRVCLKDTLQSMLERSKESGSSFPYIS
ncbi:hypothetical protein CRYUN_Cryun18bG0114400 [Craigia yunnanensis]